MTTAHRLIRHCSNRTAAINLIRVFQLRDSLQACMETSRYINTLLTEDDIRELAFALKQMSPRMRTLAIVESLRTLIGVQLTPRIAFEYAWRLAGNLPLLAAGDAVHPWTHQAATEWMPIQVLSATQAPRDSTRLVYTARFLAGTACPRTAEVVWSSKFTFVLARRLGYSLPWGPSPFKNPLELVSMRMLAEVTPERSLPDNPGIAEIKCPAGMITHNKMIAKARRRIQYVCPLSVTIPCWECPAGNDICVAAVRPYSLGTDAPPAT